MDVKLNVLEGKNAGQKVPVPGPKFLVGRAEDCHLRPASSEISRHHAVILVEDGYVAVRDFASKNGTFVNGERAHGERELKNGDRLRFGPLEFEVELAVEVGGKKKPKVQSVEEAALRTAQARSSDDLDIFGLLGEQDDTVASAPALGDTQTVDTTQTAAIEGEQDGGQPDRPPADSKKKERKKKGGLGGRFGEAEKPKAESSREAAQDVLRQFISRRR